MKKAKGKMEPARETASASVLVVSKDQKRVECIFCKSNHDSQNCETARKLTLDERKEIVKRENACFNCLKRGHVSQKCKIKTKCDWCSRRHVLLMCPGIFRKDNVPVNKPDNIEKKVEEHNLASFCEMQDVCLQTLRVKLFSLTREKIVRAIIDTASQCSYVRSDIARELGYVRLGELEISHSVFGGIKSAGEKHDIFKIHVKNLDNSYACNFAAMNQDVICGPISRIGNYEWADELQANNITLTDIGHKNSSIDVLIGADVAGKLMTGKKFTLRNGLSAFETLLGWTLIGKLPKEPKRSDAVTTVITMFVQEASLCDLWSLDTIGITDSIEKTSRLERDKRTREFLIELARRNANGRYEVRLPWAEDRVPISSNYDIARNRLKKCLDKLTNENLLEEYDSVFKKWLAEGVIEKVPDEETNNFGHYLPHRPVIKSHSTTRIRPVFDAPTTKAPSRKRAN